MRRLRRTPLRFDGFELFAAYGEQQKVPLRRNGAAAAFASELAKEVEQAAASDGLIYGRRVEAMFERVVAAIGACRLLKREDVGDVYHAIEGDVGVPDFRIILSDGRQVLVEVKNAWSGKNGRKKQRLRRKDVGALKRYADAMGCELLFATYWVNWRNWTLVRVNDFATEGERCTLGFEDAFCANRMGDLGDIHIGTRWPIRVRIVADPSKPRSLDESGRASFTALARELYCEDRRIDDPVAQRIAMYLAAFGSWKPSGPAAICDEDDCLVGVESTFQPQAPEDMGDQPMAFVATLSGIASAMHMMATEGEQGVTGVRATFEPGALGTLIPKDYKSDELPLWRIVHTQTERTPLPIEPRPSPASSTEP